MPSNVAKVDIGAVAESLKKHHADPALLRKVIEDLNLSVQLEEDTPPAIKKQNVVLLSDPDGVLPNTDFVAWELQISESDSPATTIERITQAVCDYNATKKGRIYPAHTIGEALENIPAKLFKEHELWVRTKTPVLVIVTDNEVTHE